MKHFRYLALISGMVCIQAGTLDELRTQILSRQRRNGFRTTFEEIDTWTEPGRVFQLERGGVINWEAAT